MKHSLTYTVATLFFFLFIFVSNTAYSVSTSEDSHKTEHAQDKNNKIDPGKIIIDHVVDKYSWHIATIGETHISLPLPVLLYTQERGFFCFWSSKFHHGHDSYKGFKIAQDGIHKGNIVEINPDGTIKEETPWDFSITKIVTAIFFSIILLFVIFRRVAVLYQRRRNMPPTGIQSLMEPLIIFIRDDVARENIGPKYEKFTPFLLSIFFFILFNNLLGLIPIFPAGANVTGNISVTMVLALFTFMMTTISGNKHYWREIFNPPAVPWFLKIPIPLVPIIEFVGILIKPIVLMIRLFANISAGHIVMLGFFTLIFIFGNISPGIGYGVSVFSVVFTVFITFLELLVAFIQAYVFTILSAIYFGMAVGEGH